jgi:hypothetical protein
MQIVLTRDPITPEQKALRELDAAVDTARGRHVEWIDGEPRYKVEQEGRLREWHLCMAYSSRPSDTDYLIRIGVDRFGAHEYDRPVFKSWALRLPDNTLRYYADFHTAITPGGAGATFGEAICRAFLAAAKEEQREARR